MRAISQVAMNLIYNMCSEIIHIEAVPKGPFQYGIGRLIIRSCKNLEAVILSEKNIIINFDRQHCKDTLLSETNARPLANASTF